MTLRVDPRVKVVRDEREREPALLRPTRVGDEVERRVLLARERIPELDLLRRRHRVRMTHTPGRETFPRDQAGAALSGPLLWVEARPGSRRSRDLAQDEQRRGTVADGTPAVELPAGQLADAVSADRAAEWPRLYRLELDVRLAVERGQPKRPVDATSR